MIIQKHFGCALYAKIFTTEPRLGKYLSACNIPSQYLKNCQIQKMMTKKINMEELTQSINPSHGIRISFDMNVQQPQLIMVSCVADVYLLRFQDKADMLIF
jgi:hypothetical protein